MNGLEALDSVRCALSLCPNHNYKEENDLCNIIEKELKAFQIIKEKEVDLGSLLFYIRSFNHPLAFYNKCIVNEKKKLTKDEFDLLEEVLE